MSNEMLEELGTGEQEISVVVEPVEEQPVIEPVVVPVVVELEEQRYTYQPKDEDGRPLGAPQVIKYRTQEELIARFEEQNVLLQRRLRVETRKNRLGIVEADDVPEDAQRYQGPVDFSKKELSPDDKVRAARVIGIDPEHFDEATEALFESTLGVKPEDLRTTLRTLQADNENYKAVRESEMFMADNPEYYKCQENGTAISVWVKQRNLAPVRTNFQKAYDVLKAAGVMIQSPESSVTLPAYVPKVEAVTTQEVIPSVEPVEEPVVTVQEPVTAPVVSRIPTGLTRNQSANEGQVRTVADDIIYEYQPKDSQGKPNGEKKIWRGLAAIEHMPSDVYRHRVLSEKGFVAKEKKLMAEAEAKRNKARE